MQRTLKAGPTLVLLMTALLLGCTGGGIQIRKTSEPLTRPLVGLSMGGRSVQNLQTALAVFPSAQILRIYTPLAPTVIAANPQFTAAVSFVKAHGGEVWYSFKVDPGASWGTVVRDWAASGVKIRWTYDHEADRAPSQIGAAAFVATFTSLIVRATPFMGANVSEQTIFTAYLLRPGQPHGNPDAWYVPSARVLGFDCYDPSALPLVIAYAQSKGKPYTLPEMGAGGPNSNIPGDAGALAFAHAMALAWSGSPPLGVAWFSQTGQGGKSSSLANLPATKAYLATLS